MTEYRSYSFRKHCDTPVQIRAYSSDAGQVAPERDPTAGAGTGLCTDCHFLREVHHRVKNNLQVVCSLLRLQSRALPDPQVREVFRRSEERIQCMALVYDNLDKGDGYDTVPLHDYLQEMFRQFVMGARRSDERPEIEFRLQPIFVSSRLATSLGLLCNEVLSNHLRLRPVDPHARLEVCLNRNEEQVNIELREQRSSPATPVTLGSMEQQILDALVSQVRGVIECQSDACVVTRIAFPIEALAG